MPKHGEFSSTTSDHTEVPLIDDDKSFSFYPTDCEPLAINESFGIRDYSYHSEVTAFLRSESTRNTKKGIGFGVGRAIGKDKLSAIDVLETVEVEGKRLKEFIALGACPRLLEGIDDPKVYDRMLTVACYAYFLRIGACYVEIPSQRYIPGGAGNAPSFTKFIATSNMDIANLWLSSDPGLKGSAPKPMPKSLVGKLGSIDEVIGELDSSELCAVPHTKFDYDKNTGLRKVVNAQKFLDLETKGLRVYPLFMLKAVVDTLYKKSQEGCSKVSYLKDSSEVKEAYVSFDRNFLEEVYGESKASEALETAYNGGFFENPSLVRGYIRFPSVGESKYEDITRSLSYSRIIDIEYGSEPDLSYVGIDVNGIRPTFFSAINENMENPDALESITKGLRDFGLSRYNITPDPFVIESWFTNEYMLKGTAFMRELALFMMSNPSWFGNYTGAGVEGDSTSTSGGLL